MSTPLHEPELSERRYEGTYKEAGYGSDAVFGIVTFAYTEDDDYSYDPDAGEVEWLSDDVISGPEVDWAEDAGRRKVGVAVLMHYLKRDPSDEEVQTFMDDIGPSMEAGQEFSMGVNALIDAGLETKPAVLRWAAQTIVTQAGDHRASWRVCAANPATPSATRSDRLEPAGLHGRRPCTTPLSES